MLRVAIKYKRHWLLFEEADLGLILAELFRLPADVLR
jgi:hypothetical protein